MSNFADLGEDLADIVCDFAFKCRYSEFFYSLKRYLEILCFRIPKHLLNRRLYSPKYRRVVPNPLKVFEPIQNFGSYRDLFDWSTVYAALAVRFPEKDSEGVRLSGELACTVRTRLEKRVGVRHILSDAGLFARLRQGFQAHTVTDD